MKNRIYIKELDLKDGRLFQIMANEGLWSLPLNLKELFSLLRKLLK